MTDKEIVEHIARDGCYLIACTGEPYGEVLNAHHPCPFYVEKDQPCHYTLDTQNPTAGEANLKIIKKQAQDRLDEWGKCNYVEGIE
jgi:hypothetical protein